MVRRGVQNRQFTVDPARTSVGIAFSMMQRHGGVLIAPGLGFMVLCAAVLWTLIAIAPPPADDVAKDTAEEAGMAVVFVLLTLSVLIGAMIGWLYVRCLVMLTATSLLQGERPSSWAVYGVANSIHRSSQATRGHFWFILVTGFMGAVIGFAILIGAVTLLDEILADEVVTFGEITWLVVLFLAWPVIGTFSSIVRVVQYWRMTTPPRTASQHQREIRSPFETETAVEAPHHDG